MFTVSLDVVHSRFQKRERLRDKIPHLVQTNKPPRPLDVPQIHSLGRAYYAYPPSPTWRRRKSGKREKKRAFALALVSHAHPYAHLLPSHPTRLRKERQGRKKGYEKQTRVLGYYMMRRTATEPRRYVPLLVPCRLLKPGSDHRQDTQVFRHQGRRRLRQRRRRRRRGRCKQKKVRALSHVARPPRT